MKIDDRFTIQLDELVNIKLNYKIDHVALLSFKKLGFTYPYFYSLLDLCDIYSVRRGTIELFLKQHVKNDTMLVMDNQSKVLLFKRWYPSYTSVISKKDADKIHGIDAIRITYNQKLKKKEYTKYPKIVFIK